MENLYSVKEICVILKVKRVLVLRLIHNGQLHAFRLGGGRLWRVRERDLSRFIGDGSTALEHSADGIAPAEIKSF